MGKLLNEEISESKKPLILIYTNNKNVQNLFFEQFSKKFSILYISASSPQRENGQTYHIKTSDINLLPHLEEKIDYAVIFIEQQKDKENINYLVEKITADDSKSILLIPAEEYKDYTSIALKVKPYKNIIPALYGNILEDMPSNDTFLKIIRMAKDSEKIKLNGNDLMPVFPISRTDLFISIKQLLFSHKPHALYYLFYKKPQTLLSAVHLLAHIEPELELEINHEDPIEKYEERKDMSQYLFENLNLKILYLESHLKGFLHAVENLKLGNKKAYVPPVKKRKRINIPKLNSLKLNPSLPLALFSSLLLFLLINGIFSILGIIYLKSSIHAFEKSDFATAKERGAIAKATLSVPMPTLRVIESTISYIPFMENSYNTLHLITNTAKLGAVSAELIEKLEKVKDGISKNDFEKIIIDIQYLYHSGLRALLSQENRTISNLLKPEISKSISLINIMPTLLGYDSEKEYLLLFMNNAELRPTGGFIGSVGKLIVKEGKVKEFTIQDVYDLDGQLTKHVEPNYIIRRNLQPHLYLRDSNFDLDFQRSARLSAMIYQLESGDKPDGVVAVDFNLIKKILEITGPVNLSNYNKTITSDNSLEFLQNTIEENFFPGSTQKKDVLNELFTTIALRLEEKPEYLVSIGLALPELFDQKHILLAYQNQDIQSLISALNFGGQVPFRENLSNDTIYDTLGFNEANIGVNKVNKDVTRSIYYEANLSTRISKAKITIRNSSDTDNYKTYLRLITPRNSTLRKILIDGKEAKTIEAITDYKIYEANSFSPEKNVLEVDSIDDYLKTIFGTIIEIPKKNIKTIEFEYTNPLLFIENEKTLYDLYVIKQAGTNTTPFSFSVKFPKDFNASGENINSYGNGIVKLEDDIIFDLNQKINFIKK